MLVALLAGTAGAETPQEQAERLFKEGRAALGAKDPEKACELFEESIKIDPTATGVMLNLGLCYEQLHKYASSLRWFRKAQVAAAENSLTDYEAAAKEHTTQLSPKVSLISIQLDNVPAAEVRVDNRRVEPTEYGRVEVDAGAHVITGTTPDGATARQEVNVEEAQQADVKLTFTVLVDEGKSRRTIGIGLAAAGGAALVGSLIWAIADKSAFDESRDMAERDRLKDRQKIWNTSLTGLGVAMVGVGAYLYFFSPGIERRPVGTAFTPVVTPDGVGIAFDGTF